MHDTLTWRMTLSRAQRQGLATPGSSLGGGWRLRGSAHTRIGSREAIFYDEDFEAKATPFPSSDRRAQPIAQLLFSLPDRLCQQIPCKALLLGKGLKVVEWTEQLLRTRGLLCS